MAPSLLRPTFRLDLKFVVSRADGTRKMVWMRFPGDFAGKSVVCALAEAAEAACEEVRRISKRPPYDLIGHLGADYHLINARFTRIDVEDEDDVTDDGRHVKGLDQGAGGPGGSSAKIPF